MLLEHCLKGCFVSSSPLLGTIMILKKSPFLCPFSSCPSLQRLNSGQCFPLFVNLRGKSITFARRNKIEIPASHCPNYGKMLPCMLWAMPLECPGQTQTRLLSLNTTPHAAWFPLGAGTWGWVNSGALEQGKAEWSIHSMFSAPGLMSPSPKWSLHGLNPPEFLFTC